MKKVVTFGEIMLRLSAPGFARLTQATHFNVTFGGGEANVSLCLAHLGIPAEHVTRFPNNDLGKSAVQMLRQHGVGTEPIIFGGDRIGIYFLETGAIVRPSKVLYDRSNSAFAHVQPGMIDWQDVLKEAQWFHWTGITPAISDGAAKVCLEAIQTANKLGITVSADTNYRKNLWQYGKTARDVMPELVAGCDLIVCGKGDAADLFGIEPKKGEESGSVSVCKQIMQHFPRVKKIVNTKRSSVSASHNTLSGSLWNGAELLKTSTYDMVPIIDRIGGGDAFMGGLIYGLLTFRDDQRALDFGVAASVLKHTIEGDANVITADEVDMVLKDPSGKLLR